MEYYNQHSGNQRQSCLHVPKLPCMDEKWPLAVAGETGCFQTLAPDWSRLSFTARTLLFYSYKISVTIPLSDLFAGVTVQGMERNKCHRSKPTSNQQKANKTTPKKKNVNKSHGFHLQPHHFQAPVHTLQGWFESSYRARKHWEQSGEGAEPIPWSPIIRCARPWRETRAQSAINKGVWECRVVTVARIFSDRHHAFYETCLYHSSKSKTFFQPLVGMLWAKEL